MDGLHDLGGKQGFGRVKYPSAPHNENWRPLVRALHAFAIESHIYNNVDGVAQIEMRDDPGGVRGVVVHVVTIADLARPAMAASVMRNDAVALLQEVEHLGVPVVGAERPAMMEDDGLRVLGPQSL